MRFATLVLLAASLTNAAEPPKDPTSAELDIYSDKDCKNKIDAVPIEMTDNSGNGGACYDFTKYAGQYLGDMTLVHSVLSNYKDADCNELDGRGNKIPDYQECWQIPEGLYFRWQYFDVPDISNPLCCA